jgi:hypothetical protein
MQEVITFLHLLSANNNDLEFSTNDMFTKLSAAKKQRRGLPY